MKTTTNDSQEPYVAAVGAGYWGKNLIRNFHELKALRAICDNNAQSLDKFRQQYDTVTLFNSYEDVLADANVRAVSLATPAETHADMVRQALLADKDVFVEKPLCLSVPEGEDLVALAREKKRILMVGHLLWYHPAVLKLKEMVAAGDLGRIQYIYSNRLNLGRIRREENILWSFAPHDLSVILGLLGEMPDAVRAQGGNYLHEKIDDVTVSLLSFPSGVKAHIFVSWLHPYKEQKLIVVGDRGMAVFNDVEETNKLLLYPHSIDWANQVPVAKKAEAKVIDFVSEEPLRAECAHFLDCVSARQRPRTDGEEGLKVLKVLQQCQQALQDSSRGASAEVGKPTNYFAHESAWIDDDVTIGDGTRMWHGSRIMKGSSIGQQCNIGQNVVVGPAVTIGNKVKIQNNVSVYEGVTLEDEVFCGPSMVFTNIINPRSSIPRMHEVRETRVKKGATIGANATIVCGVTIGRHAFVGAGSVVTKDVPDYALVFGSPARIQGWMCACGVKLVFNKNLAVCRSCSRRYSCENDLVTSDETIASTATDEAGNVVRLVNPS